MKKGFWRESTDSINIVKCEHSNCGNNESQRMMAGDQLCNEGHTGPICETCIPGLYYKKKDQCMNC